MNSPTPSINVTPLIDVLLVLLIIFMVISPAKPTDFKTKIPQEPKEPTQQNVTPHPHTLVVGLNPDLSVSLNKEQKIATIDEPEKLIQRLSEIFLQRAENRAYSPNAEFRNDLTEAEKIEKTVFIKAPRSIDYGKVVKIIDAVKIAGANPISLQIDDLN